MILKYNCLFTLCQCNIFIIISRNILAQIAHNVLGIRRSSPPYKALRSNPVGWNVGERKHHKGRKPGWCFSNPEPPNRRRSVYRLLDAVYIAQQVFMDKYYLKQNISFP